MKWTFGFTVNVEEHCSHSCFPPRAAHLLHKERTSTTGGLCLNNGHLKSQATFTSMMRSSAAVRWCAWSLCAIGWPALCRAQEHLQATWADRYVVQRDAQLALDRNLLNNNRDSVLYWTDRQLCVPGKRITNCLPLFDDRVRTLAHFFVGAFQHVLDDIAVDRHFWINYLPPPYEGPLQDRPANVRTRPLLTREGLYNLWALQAQRVLDDINTQVADAEDREFLGLYWMAAVNTWYAYEARPPFDEADVQQRAHALLARRPDHPQFMLLRLWAREYVPGKRGFGFSLQGGGNRLGGELEQQFASTWNFGLRLDMTYKRLMYSFNLRTLQADLAADMPHGDSLWEKGQAVTCTMLGMQLGYMLVDRPAYRIMPTAGIHLARDHYSPDEEQSITKGFVQPTLDLVMDLKLNFKAQAEARRAAPTDTERWSPRRHGYWLLRGSVGYAPLGFGPVIGPQGSILYWSIGIGGFMQAASYR